MLSSISTTDLRAELDRRQNMLQDLIRQRDALNAELEALGEDLGPHRGGLVHLVHVREHFGLREVADRLAEELLLLGEDGERRGGGGDGHGTIRVRVRSQNNARAAASRDT